MGSHVELIVTRTATSKHDVELEYLLRGETVGLMPFGRRPLDFEPVAYFQDHLHEISRQRRTASSRGARDIGLRSAGAALFRRLLPEPLRETLWDLREEAESLEVITDEPSIPWELMRFAGRRADPFAEGPFFAEQFVMTRWVPGISRIHHLPFRRAAVVIGDRSELGSAHVERDELLRLAAAEPGRAMEEIGSDLATVIATLTAGKHQGWHFIGHGASSGVDSDHWRFDLADGNSLSPGHLSGEARGLGRKEPLVFLNACQTGQGGRTLTGAGGWASAFVQAGAGAFVGSLWEVPDSAASSFAIAFYRSFLAGTPIGVAMRQARQAVRDEDPDDPTWLAYVLYAHRGAVCREAGAEVVEEEAGAAREPRPAAFPAVERAAGGTGVARGTSPPAAASPELARIAAMMAEQARAGRRGRAAAPSKPTVRFGGSTRGREEVDPVRGASAEPVAPPIGSGPSTPRPGDQRLHGPDGSLLLYVPRGEYTVGAEGVNDWTRPVHRVQLSPFWIARHPVTNEQYARFLDAHPGAAPPEFWQDERFNAPQQPVVGVSWEDAEAYCRWVGLALPSEAQWEAAARGPEARVYPWGPEPPEPRHANFGGRLGATSPVDAHPDGAGPFGTLDQAGNVWEWCADSWSLTAYRQRGDGVLDPITRGDTSMRVLRGGSWVNPGRDLRAAYRDRATARLRFNTQGFRCVLPADP